MYEVLDNFLLTGTWHTRHASDEQRFYEVLDQIVWQDEFNAERMAEYMRRKMNLHYGDNESPFAMAIHHYRTSAGAVRDFLKYSKTVSRKSEHSSWGR